MGRDSSGQQRSGDATRVVIGRISGLHGVRGWVKLFSHTAPRENLLDYRAVELGRVGADGAVEWTPAELADGRRQGKTLVGRIVGVEDRDDAARWVGAEIAVPRDALPEAAEGEYYWFDLIGLAVENVEGDALGRVESLIETGAHDVLVVRGERERLIPFAVGPVVQSVDLDAGRILVDWDAGY